MSKVAEVQVGLASCGIAAGAEPVFQFFAKALAAQKVRVKPVGCLGMCFSEPLVAVVTEDGERFVYGPVDVKKAERIVEEHVKGGSPVEEFLAKEDGLFYNLPAARILTGGGANPPQRRRKGEPLVKQLQTLEIKAIGGKPHIPLTVGMGWAV